MLRGWGAGPHRGGKVTAGNNVVLLAAGARLRHVAIAVRFAALVFVGLFLSVDFAVFAIALVADAVMPRAGGDYEPCPASFARSYGGYSGAAIFAFCSKEESSSGTSE